MLRELGIFRPFAVVAFRGGGGAIVDSDIEGSVTDQLEGLDDYLRGRGDDFSWAAVVTGVAVQGSDAVRMNVQMRGAGVHNVLRHYRLEAGGVSWGHYLRVRPGEGWWQDG